MCRRWSGSGLVVPAIRMFSFPLPTSPSPGRRILRCARLLAPLWLASWLSAAWSPYLGATPSGFVEAGAPSFVVLGPEALGLGTAPVDLHRLPDGRMIAVGHHELALGDGVRWQSFIPADGEPRVDTHSIAVDPAGTLYAGIAGGFARIDLGADGRWRFVKVASLPAGTGLDQTVPTNVAAVGDDWLWWWGSGAVVAWHPGVEARIVGRSNAPERAFLLGGKLHLNDVSTGGLFRLEEGALRSVERPASAFVEQTITSAVPWKEGRSLTGTIREGILVYDGKGFHPFIDHGVLGGAHRINDLCATEGGFFAAAVDNVGVVFFDAAGRVVQVLDRSVDHRLSRVKRLLRAPGGIVWALLNDGLARIAFPAPVSHFEPLVATGLAYARPCRRDGRLWLISDGQAQRGVYDEDHRLTRFEIDSPDSYLSSLTEIEGEWLAGTRDGLFRHEAEGRWSRVLTGPSSPYFRAAPVTPGRWLYAAENEVGWLRRAGDGLAVDRFPVPDLGHVYGIVTDADGVVWAELGMAKVARIEPTLPQPTVRVYGLSEGLPNGWAQAFLWHGEARINLDGHIMRWERTTDTFVADTALVRQNPTLDGALGRPALDARGRLWSAQQGAVRVTDADSGSPDEAVASAIPRGLLPLYFTPQPDGVMWMHQPMRLARFDPSMPEPTPVPLRAIISEVLLPGSRRTLFAVGRELPALAASDNYLIVHFLAPDNPIGQSVTFQTKLEGTDGSWVSAGATGTATFNHLNHGSYVLHVRPRLGAEIGEEATLAFTVLAPWYRTPAAYAAYGVGAVGIFLLVGWGSAYIERREKSRLARLVGERTRELHAMNQQLSQLSQAIEQSPVAVYITDLEGGIVFANPRMRELMGCAERELLGKKLGEVTFDPEEPERYAEIWSAVRAGDSWQGRLAARRRDGALVHLRAAVSPLRGTDGTIRNHLALLEDITRWLEDQDRQRRLEVQLFQSQKLESLGTLAGGIAHDFNNILTGILGYCEMAALATRENQAVQDDLREIRAAGLRAKDLVKQILTFSRRGESKLTVVDLAKVVEEALRLVRASTPATIAIVKELESGAVRADPTQIHQVVLNLCTNAIHAMKGGPGRLTVAVRRTAVTAATAADVVDLKPGPHLCLTIADTGRGMDAATLARVFDPFYTTKKPGEGTGLGLSIVQGIVVNHHAALRVRSEPGVGTTFDIFLPASSEPVAPSGAGGALPRGGQREIMVVDDEPMVARFAAARLRQFDFRTTVFTDPREALAAGTAEPGRFHAIVTDLTMPHLTGVELVERLRGAVPSLPAVIVSGFGKELSGLSSMTAPRTVGLTKPFEGEQLLRAVAVVLGLRATLADT